MTLTNIVGRESTPKDIVRVSGEFLSRYVRGSVTREQIYVDVLRENPHLDVERILAPFYCPPPELRSRNW